MRRVPTRFLICVPTYDERENLERMVEALDGVRESGDASGDVLVIDDSSPDGTGGSPTSSPPAGRGCTCCTDRARRASAAPTSTASAGRSRATTSYVLEMDCDFSHDPRAVPSLLAAARAGADLVLGSRYCPGGRRRELGPRAAPDLDRRLPVCAHAARRRRCAT